MVDIPHVTEIKDWNSDVITVQIGGVRESVVRRRAQKFANNRIGPSTEIIDVMDGRDTDGVLSQYIVTFKRLD